MFSRPGLCALVVCALAAAVVPAHAQQTLNFTFGHFSVRSEDARIPGDVIVAHRGTGLWAFDVGEFSGATFGAEYLIPIGRYIEAGAGIGFTQQTVPTVYNDFVDADGSEIEHDMRLRIVPAAFTFRLLPLGQSSAVQPYIGGGLGLFAWRYSESGDFVDFSARPNAIFREQYVESGSATGPIALAGVRVALGTVSAGFEARYQSADAEVGARIPTTSRQPRIDLGGWTYQATVGYRF